MTDAEQYPPMHLPPRVVPIPTTVSETARGVLSLPAFPAEPWPTDLSDKDAVAAVVAARDAPAGEAPGMLANSCFGTAPTGVPVTEQHHQFGPLSIYEAVPEGVSDDDPRVYLAIHGAWITGGGELSRMGAEMTAGVFGVRTWAVDYRMPPHHPYRTPLDDCIAAYRELLKTHKPENIAVGGVSGGGNLTLAMLLRARDEGLPMPSAAIVYTPFADMTLSGDTIHGGLDSAFQFESGELQTIRDIYVDGHDWLDPYVSPVFGDFTKGFPPTQLCTGTRDFLLSDTVRIHRSLRDAGIEADLHVWEAAQHFLFLGLAPEDLARNAESRRFLDRHWGVPAPEAKPSAPLVAEQSVIDDPSSKARDAIVGTWDVEQKSPLGTRTSELTFRDEGGVLVAEAPADDYGTVYGEITTDGDEVRWVATVRKPFKMSIVSRVTVSGDTFIGEAKGRIGGASPVSATRRR